MGNEKNEYTMLTLQQLFTHKEDAVREKAKTLSSNPHITGIGLTMSELLTHENGLVRREARALYDEIMSFEYGKRPSTQTFEIPEITQTGA